MNKISDKYKHHTIDDLRFSARVTDREKFPDLYEEISSELENRIKARKDMGNFNFKNGTEIFLDEYVDETLTELTFDNNAITVKSKITKSYFYIIMIIIISLLVIIPTIMGKGNYYFFAAYVLIAGSYFGRIILDEIYQYSRSTKINFETETVYISLSRRNNSKLRVLFNLKDGDYEFKNIKKFFWDGSRNFIYEPTSWIYVIKILFEDGSINPLCYSSTKNFTQKFTSYLNHIIKE